MCEPIFAGECAREYKCTCTVGFPHCFELFQRDKVGFKLFLRLSDGRSIIAQVRYMMIETCLVLASAQVGTCTVGFTLLFSDFFAVIRLDVPCPVTCRSDVVMYVRTDFCWRVRKRVHVPWASFFRFLIFSLSPGLMCTIRSPVEVM